MKQFSLVLSMVFFAFTTIFAQVTGTVTDEAGEPLIGANVLVKGTTTGVITDFDGKYSISANEGDVLVISYTGYDTKEVSVGSGSVVDIVLSEGVTLTTAVVTATGIERESRSVVYANQTVKGDDLLSQPSKNALEALRGKTAGVKISTGSGSVGASTRIVLRGEGSLTGNNNALIVVDGIPIDNASTRGGAGTSTGGYADYGNRFNDLNPEDIESVTVLKGPSATSLYGSRGASGVLVITTKKGGEGKDGNIKVALNSSLSTEEAYVLLQRQDRFGQGYDNLHFDSGENWSWGPAFDGVVRPWTSPIDADGDGALESLTRPYSVVPNQLEEFFNRGSTFNNSISLSGAKGGFTYYASYSNADQKGILENTSYKRNTVNFSSSAKFSEKFKTDFKVSYAHTNQNTAQEGSRAFEGNNAYAMAVQSPVNIPFGEVRDYQSPFHDVNGYWGSYSSVNPYFILNEYGNEGEFGNFLGKMSMTYSPLEGLDLIGRFGTNIVTGEVNSWSPPFSPQTQLVWGDDLALTTRTGRHENLGDYSNNKSRNINLDFSGLANYSRVLDQAGDITLNATAGFNWFQRETNSVTGFTVGGLVVPGWYHLRNSILAAESDEFSTQYRIYGLLGNVSLGYKNALFLEYSARNDWSSTLPEENNSFFYHSVGASAVLSEFIDVSDDILSYLKLRTSFGTTGKDAGLYLLESVFEGNPTLVGLGDFAITYPLNGQAGFTVGNTIGNPDLKPELTTTFEIGADVGLWNNRVNVEYTYYNSKHSDQIVRISLPASSGFDFTSTNIGEMVNKGHELSLNLKPIDGMVPGLTWDLNFMYSKNINEVKKITDDIDELIIGGPFLGVSLVAKEGLPFGTFKAQAPKTNDAGQVLVDGNTGFPLYTDDEVYLGSYQPDYTASIGTNIGYKGLGFNILFDIRQGGNFVSQTKFFTEFNGTALHTADFNRESYIFPNSMIENADGTLSENTIEINEQDYFTNYDPAASTYIIDASFIKLREIGLSYRLPNNLLKNLPISSAKVSLFAKNLRFWLPDENTFSDPEVNGPALTGNAAGIETTQTPPAKSYGINLGITF